VWADIDYMNQYRDFENDQNSWGYDAGKAFLDRLHASGRHFVPIVDAAIYVPNPANASDAYPTFDRGVAADAFMLNPDGSLYIGDVWPGYTVFPDWVGAVLGNSRTFEWWAGELATYFEKVPFSGIWIDMSEVSSFCVGSCGSGNLTLNPVHPPFKLPGEPGNEELDYPEGFNITNATEAASVSAFSSSRAAATSTTSSSSASASSSSTTVQYLRTTPTPGVRNVNHPPYVINNIQGDLAVHAVSPNATHHGSPATQEYDFHNIFGHQILNATYAALLTLGPNKRPFIIGRSTFAGSGRWAGHWGGDNASLWSLMYFSIAQALSFSIFGIPMFGVDTCGFSGNTDMELCSRWMQLSAFFPFYRNHNVLSTIPQEPYRWAAVAEASRVAMKIRYSLLPYMYTAFWRAHNEGETVMRALAWEFPAEPWLADADWQFMLGDAVMVVPCLVQGATSVDGVFPGAGSGTVWYDWYTHAPVEGVAAGENVTIAAPLGHIPVYLRGGYIVPTQEPGMTTKQSRQNPWGLLVALDGSGTAKGGLYVDDGESVVSKDSLLVEVCRIKSRCTLTTNHGQFSSANSTLSVTSAGSYKDNNGLGVVTILGVTATVSDVRLNGDSLDRALWVADGASKTLSVGNLTSLTSLGAWSSSWKLTWT
jgi:alpha-glucosidase